MPLPTLPDPPKDQAEVERQRIKAIIDGWMNECSDIQDLVVEGLLANLPSMKHG